MKIHTCKTTRKKKIELTDAEVGKLLAAADIIDSAEAQVKSAEPAISGDQIRAWVNAIKPVKV